MEEKDYKKLYEDVLERAKSGLKDKNYYLSQSAKEVTEFLFPQLKETKDEKVKRELTTFLIDFNNGYYSRPSEDKIDSWIKWIDKKCEQKPVECIKLDNEFENQISHLIVSVLNGEHEYNEGFVKYASQSLLGFAKKEQNHTDKVEPSFKVGDWIVYAGLRTYKVVEIHEGWYSVIYSVIDSNDRRWSIMFESESLCHIWTINDAKDGDVLVTNSGRPFIFKGCLDERHTNSPSAYCGIDCNNYFVGYNCNAWWTDENVYPATKEQCDLLFDKMKEAGYKWDVEKKELRKIEQKHEINDDVLSRFAFYQYDNEILYLSSVFVEERSRKRGYGSKILKAAEEVAKTFEISKIRLKVERKTWMDEWYKKNGYEYLSSEGEYDWLEKRVDNLEPKFNVGDWIIHNKNIELANSLMIVAGKNNNEYLCRDKYGQCSYNSEFIDKNYRLWTIQDAKDGDVLATKKGNPFIYDKDRYNNGLAYYYAGLDVNKELTLKSPHHMLSHFGELCNIFPATKEQRGLLFQKMKEAGYEWNAEKKELKKIEILMSLDEAIEHCKEKSCGNNACALEHKQLEEWLTELKELKKQKPFWNEEDEEMCEGIIFSGDHNCYLNPKETQWIKELKDRFLPQPKQEWSEEDEKKLNDTIFFLNEFKEVYHDDAQNCIKWVKSFKPQQNQYQYDKGYNDGYSAAKYNQWKPTDKQMEDFRMLLDYNIGVFDYAKFMSANSLYDDLKKNLID